MRPAHDQWQAVTGQVRGMRRRGEPGVALLDGGAGKWSPAPKIGLRAEALRRMDFSRSAPQQLFRVHTLRTHARGRNAARPQPIARPGPLLTRRAPARAACDVRYTG